MSVITPAQRLKDGKTSPTRTYSKKQENQIAKDLNGTTTKNSGATLLGGKGDVLISGLMSIECKTKTKNSNSITIKKDWLDKIKKESLFDCKKYYSLAFNFGPNGENYFIIDENLFQTLLDLLK